VVADRDGPPLQQARLRPADKGQAQEAVRLDVRDQRPDLVGVGGDDNMRRVPRSSARGGQVTHVIDGHRVGKGREQIAQPGDDRLLRAGCRVQGRQRGQVRAQCSQKLVVKSHVIILLGLCGASGAPASKRVVTAPPGGIPDVRGIGAAGFPYTSS